MAVRIEVPFRQIAENSPNMVFMVGPSGYVFVNRQAVKTMGYSRKEFFSPKFSFLNLIVPEHKPLAQKMFALHAAGREAPPLEYTLITKKGKRIETIVFTKVSRYKGENVVLGTAVDISSLKQTERTLRESEERYRRVMEFSPQPIIIFPSCCEKIIDANSRAAELLGSTRSIIGRSAVDLFEPKETELCCRKFNEVTKDKKAVNFVAHLVCENNTRLPVQVHAGPVVFSGKSLIMCMFSDVSELKKLSDIGTLSSAIAHDLRGMLGVIETAAYNIKQKAVAPEQIAGHLDMIERKTSEGYRLIRNLLTFAKVYPPDYEELSVVGCLKEGLASLLYRFPDGNFRVVTDFAGKENLLVRADSVHIQQLFGNLLDNAVQALPGQGGEIRVRIEARMTGGFFIVSINDNGSGISSEDLPFVFFPFFTRKSRGTGLGLPVCQQIVNIYGGNIEVSSDPKRGTTFSVSLPAYKK